jgi:hypothetical protein
MWCRGVASNGPDSGSTLWGYQRARRVGGVDADGNQRAAILGYDVPKESFVATATAIALFEYAARLSVKPWRDRELPPPDRDRRRPPTA